MICAVVWFLPLHGWAQTGDSGRPTPVSVRPADTLSVLRQTQDSLARVARLRRMRAQARDSAAQAANRTAAADSLARVRVSIARDSVTRDSTARSLARTRPRPPGPTVQTRAGIPKIRMSRDLLFYVVLLLALWMGILKSSYDKYYTDLFTVFFRSSLRQHQIREQLLQARLPSLLFNLFFVGCAGTFLYLVASAYAVHLGHADWQLWIASIAAVAVLYSAKFLGLKLSGWVFGMGGAVDTYIFIVFLVNKILGVALLPLVVLLAFAGDPLQSAAATLGVLLVIGMVIYRFIRSYRPVWEEVQMSRFHFFLYLCAFEIAPLLLIYKTMLRLL
jgi:hypothetical protein